MYHYGPIRLSFGSRILIKDGNLNLKYGTFNVLVGESGCGKTTLLNDLFEKLNKDNKRVLYLKQEDNFIDDLSGKDNLILMGKIYGIKLNNNKINQVLEQVGLNINLNLSPKVLSGGQKQRLLLALGLLIKAECILLDEITASLNLRINH